MISAAVAWAQDANFDKAVRAYIVKDYGTAAKHLKEHIAGTPDAAAYYLLGYSTYMLKKKAGRAGAGHSRDNEADEYFRQAYLIDPGFSPRSIDFSKYRGR